MELSIFVAKFLAVIYLSVGFAVVIGKISFERLIDDFESSPALTYVTGAFTLLLGMLLVEHHNIWEKDWPVLVTLVGWGAILKGIMLIVFPRSISYFKSWQKHPRGGGFIILALGLAFAFFGFLR